MDTNKFNVSGPQGAPLNQNNKTNNDMRSRYRNFRSDYSLATFRKPQSVPVHKHTRRPSGTKSPKNEADDKIDRALEDLFSRSLQPDILPESISRLKLPPIWPKNAFKKLSAVRNDRTVIITAVLLVLVPAIFITSPWTNKTVDNQPKKINNSASLPFSDINFTVYTPTFIPQGLTLNRASIVHTKDSVTFNLTEDGEARFFVQQQALDGSFSFNELKKKLISPTDFGTFLGQGVIGGLGSGMITALKTNDDTLIIVNCVNTVCASASKRLVENMRIATSYSQLYNSSF